jgi:hypothetical protein
MAGAFSTNPEPARQGEKRASAKMPKIAAILSNTGLRKIPADTPAWLAWWANRSRLLRIFQV